MADTSKSKNAQTDAERKRTERERRKDAGLVAVTVYVKPEDRQTITDAAKLLNDATTGKPLSARLKSYVGLLAHNLPEKIKARTRGRKIKPDDAKKTLLSVVKVHILARRAVDAEYLKKAA